MVLDREPRPNDHFGNPPGPVALIHGEDDDDPVPRGTRRWLIACDESGTGGATHYGFGTLWMPWQRRGDFQADLRDLAEQHGYPLPDWEIKWKNTNRARLPFYRALVDYFFDTPQLCFHALVARVAVVDLSCHDNDRDLARRKHFTMLLTDKIKRVMRKHPSHPQTFRVWVDPMASRYQKAHEAVEVISTNVLRKALGEVRPVDKVLVRDSKSTLQIQLCDLLLGAVMDGWLEDSTREAKWRLKQHVARRLGWPDLKADTLPGERKFNVWYLKPHGGIRCATTVLTRGRGRRQARGHGGHKVLVEACGGVALEWADAG